MNNIDATIARVLDLIHEKLLHADAELKASDLPDALNDVQSASSRLDTVEKSIRLIKNKKFFVREELIVGHLRVLQNAIKRGHLDEIDIVRIDHLESELRKLPKAS